MLSPAKQIMVLLVSEPGIMHNTLYSILQSFPGALVAAASGALTAYELLENEQADALVIGANIPLAERVALLARIKKQFPHVHTLALTTTAKNHPLLSNAGADKVLLQNCSRQDLEAAVFPIKVDQSTSEKMEPEV